MLQCNAQCFPFIERPQCHSKRRALESRLYLDRRSPPRCSVFLLVVANWKWLTFPNKPKWSQKCSQHVNNLKCMDALSLHLGGLDTLSVAIEWSRPHNRFAIRGRSSIVCRKYCLEFSKDKWIVGSYACHVDSEGIPMSTACYLGPRYITKHNELHSCCLTRPMNLLIFITTAHLWMCLISYLKRTSSPFWRNVLPGTEPALSVLWALP